MSDQRYKIVLAYDGTAYAGWQVQPDQRTIQSELERVLAALTGDTPCVHCSGRTDAGVHARSQVAHFDLSRQVVETKMQSGMNALLDDDIRVLLFKQAHPDFHARYDVIRKEYRYLIWNDRVVPPHLRLYRTPAMRKLDPAPMRAAAAMIKGEHDFAAFSANPNREIDGTRRKLYALRVLQNGREIQIVAAGSGFLYKMVRSLAGFLMRVGAGELEPESAQTILDSKTRTATVPTAAARGLFLWRVWYK